MPKKFKKQNITAIIIFSLITLFLWLGFTLYFAFKKTALTPDLQKHLTPFNAHLKKEILESLRSRIYLNDEELEKIPEITHFKIATKQAEEKIKEKSEIKNQQNKNE